MWVKHPSSVVFEIAYSQKVMNFYMHKLDIISGLEQKKLVQYIFENLFYVNSKFGNSGYFSNSEILERIFIDFINILKSIQKMNLFVIYIESGTFFMVI